MRRSGSASPPPGATTHGHRCGQFVRRCEIFRERDGALPPGPRAAGVSDGHLTISGERKHEFEEKKEHFFRREREFGSFVRTVPLPEGVKLDDVTAMFADGVLEVSVPLTVQPEAKPRKVEIAEPPPKSKTVG